jgi:hypothetical protein
MAGNRIFMDKKKIQHYCQFIEGITFGYQEICKDKYPKQILMNKYVMIYRKGQGCEWISMDTGSG